MDRRSGDLELAQIRRYIAVAQCATCDREVFAGPPMGGELVPYTRYVFELALPSLAILHEGECPDPRLQVLVMELASAGAGAAGRRHLRIVP